MRAYIIQVFHPDAHYEVVDYSSVPGGGGGGGDFPAAVAYSSSSDHHFSPLHGAASLHDASNETTFYSAPAPPPSSVDAQQHMHHHHHAQSAVSDAAALAAPPTMIVNTDAFKPYRCDYPGCGKAYKKLNGLISHHFGTHTQADLGDPKPYRCGAIGCDKQYRNTNGLGILFFFVSSCTAYHLENNHTFEGGSIQRQPGTFFPSIENTLVAAPHSPTTNTTEKDALGSDDFGEISALELAQDPTLKSHPCYLCDKIWRTSMHSFLSS